MMRFISMIIGIAVGLILVAIYPGHAVQVMLASLLLLVGLLWLLKRSDIRPDDPKE